MHTVPAADRVIPFGILSEDQCHGPYSGTRVTSCTGTRVTALGTRVTRQAPG